METRSNRSYIVLTLLLIIQVCFYSHIFNNLLSYDERHYSGRDFTIGQDGEAEEMDTKWHIVVDLDNYSLFVYKNGQLIRTYPCSGGKFSTPSPTGNYRIINKSVFEEQIGGAWLGLDVPWGSYGIHGTKFPWVIGVKHASGGCIRLYSEDAKELYLMVPLGTKVKIIQNNRPFRALKYGDSGSDVRDIEIALYELGYYKGPIDGRYGYSLVEAVAAFQKEFEIWLNGSVDKKTHDLIMWVWREHLEYN